LRQGGGPYMTGGPQTARNMAIIEQHALPARS
jgi:hypothetical protein